MGLAGQSRIREALKQAKGRAWGVVSPEGQGLGKLGGECDPGGAVGGPGGTASGLGGAWEVRGKPRRCGTVREHCE